jgi:quercetin dioxygenase-like cupin family protein
MKNIRNMKTFLSLALVSVVTAACASMQVASNSIAQEPAAKPTNEVVLKSEVEWTYLNPARKDKAPMAGTLWGDRKGNEPTGFLLKPPEDFQSPPHIHNISYRGIVIKGVIHNDDPDAAGMWMPAGSFWTQPKGEVHITAAKETDSLAYIEIEEGPYLVLPAEKAFDSGERPVNVDKSNIVWLGTSDITWIDQPRMPASANGPKVAFLWGNLQDDQLNGTLIKLPAGFTGKINSHGATFRAVVIKGQPQYQVPGETDVKLLEPGSYFSSKGESVHQLSAKAGEECIIYARTDGKYDVISVQ